MLSSGVFWLLFFAAVSINSISQLDEPLGLLRVVRQQDRHQKKVAAQVFFCQNDRHGSLVSEEQELGKDGNLFASTAAVRTNFYLRKKEQFTAASQPKLDANSLLHLQALGSSHGTAQNKESMTRHVARI